ncbi:MAG: hypothetical protein HRU31_02230 [Rhodobacteraceae bacterium]|nr:hypothetical protein [Paracoccaceae bacterium]
MTGLGLVAAVAVAPMAVSVSVPDIDSRGWAVDPAPLGMTPRDYSQAESRAFMGDFIDWVGLQTYYQFPGLSAAEDTWVVSPDTDTNYSLATVNARNGFTLTHPDIGVRFPATHILTEKHNSPFYVYGGGTCEFSA